VEGILRVTWVLWKKILPVASNKIILKIIKHVSSLSKILSLFQFLCVLQFGRSQNHHNCRISMKLIQTQANLKKDLHKCFFLWFLLQSVDRKLRNSLQQLAAHLLTNTFKMPAQMEKIQRGRYMCKRSQKNTKVPSLFWYYLKNQLFYFFSG